MILHLALATAIVMPPHASAPQKLPVSKPEQVDTNPISLKMSAIIAGCQKQHPGDKASILKCVCAGEQAQIEHKK